VSITGGSIQLLVHGSIYSCQEPTNYTNQQQQGQKSADVSEWILLCTLLVDFCMWGLSNNIGMINSMKQQQQQQQQQQ
jgi:hypothetical protein